jgi:hypothetical protein
MSITEKPFKKDFNQFILPSQTIINYDLTCNSSSGIHDPSLIYAEQIDSNKNIKLQHNNDLIMMAHASSDSSIW